MKDILHIFQPEELFSELYIDREYRTFAKQYHPDRENGNAEIFTHITLLYRKGKEKISSHSWGCKNVLINVGNKKFSIKYKKQYSLPMGEVYICSNSLVFHIEEDYRDIMENYCSNVSNFSFADEAMKEQFSLLIPQVSYTQFPLLIIVKDPALVRLRDVVEYYKGNLHPKSTAWIISGLYNIACFYRYNAYINGDISLDSIYIHPAFHQVFLFSHFFGSFGESKKKFTILPQYTLEHCNYLQRGDFYRDFRVDSDLIKLVGEQLNTSLTPPPMKEWFQTPSEGDIYKEYETWMNKILIASFGERKFFDMDTNAHLIYSKEK